jgi:hypothetical protein
MAAAPGFARPAVAGDFPPLADRAGAADFPARPALTFAGALALAADFFAPDFDDDFLPAAAAAAALFFGVCLATVDPSLNWCESRYPGPRGPRIVSLTRRAKGCQLLLVGADMERDDRSG